MIPGPPHTYFKRRAGVVLWYYPPVAGVCSFFKQDGMQTHTHTHTVDLVSVQDSTQSTFQTAESAISVFQVGG